MGSVKKYIDTYWDFRNHDTKALTHCIHNYPAMMIPQVAGTILDKYSNGAKLLFDPYCGTGTSLVEANLRNINAIGTDLNPLARLISVVKTTVLSVSLLDKTIESFEKHLYEYHEDSSLLVTIPKGINLYFWFTQEVITKLSKIKYFINNITDPKIKDFFRVAFSETVRDTSLTRNSEFKMYRIPEHKIPDHNPDVNAIMTYKLLRNRNGLRDYIKAKQNTAKTNVFDFNTIDNEFQKKIGKETIDIVVTSPPYGDSKTTVAYGQFSRLSLEWLDFDNTGALDSILMGGKKKDLTFKDKRIDKILDPIREIDEKRAAEVESFYADYYLSIANISTRLKPGGYSCYVVGNRTVKGLQLPTDEITKIFFEVNGFKHIETIIRNIPNKRMPAKNSPTNKEGKTASTMVNEYIVIMEKSL